MRLRPLQRQLERIYEVGIPLDVDDFLTSDARVASRLNAASGNVSAPEQLFVLEDGNRLDVSLYIEREVVERLTVDDPTRHLHAGNLTDFCTVLEGVSHFLYLAWNAHFERPVSLLELELQAEVDKYFASTFLFGQQRRGRIPGGLASWLFENPSIDERLDDVTRKRYWAASYYAGKFCSELEHRFLRQKRNGSLIKELRRFYRLDRRKKIDRIASRSS